MAVLLPGSCKPAGAAAAPAHACSSTPAAAGVRMWPCLSACCRCWGLIACSALPAALPSSLLTTAAMQCCSMEASSTAAACSAGAGVAAAAALLPECGSTADAGALPPTPASGTETPGPSVWPAAGLLIWAAGTSTGPAATAAAPPAPLAPAAAGSAAGPRGA